MPIGNGVFQVNERENQYIVELPTKHCDCRRWDLIGIPCNHAIAALRHKGFLLNLLSLHAILWSVSATHMSLTSGHAEIKGNVSMSLGHKLDPLYMRRR